MSKKTPDNFSEPDTTETPEEEKKFRADYLGKIQRNYGILRSILEDMKQQKPLDTKKISALRKPENIIDDFVADQARSFGDHSRASLTLNLGTSLGQALSALERALANPSEANADLYQKVWQAENVLEVAGKGLSAER